MHRSQLMGLLQDYGVRWPGEAATLGRFLDFVQTNERCFERDCWTGHVTGSAWLVNSDRSQVLLTHHKKLDRWLQVGGHSDGVSNPLAVARKEAEEESGITVTVLDRAIFDIDIHEIPARKLDPAHFHFDVRFVLQANDDVFRVSDESHALAWAPMQQLDDYTDDESVRRMARKWLGENRS
jgi:8-oxo-dGTP pyrophosphatase MutT (NUDIX family)